MPAPKLAADYRPRIEQLLSFFGRDTGSEAGARLLDGAVAFADLVAAWNDRVDLTAARNPDELVDLLFADAAAVIRDRAADGESKERERWLDVGSGMGAPGIGLALLEPALEVTLLEPRVKRVSFLRTALHGIQRMDVRVERARVEALSAASCDVAISRATLPPVEWLREGTRVAKRDVWVLLARDAAPEAPDRLVEREVTYRWPLTGMERRAIRYRRLAL